MIKQYFLKTSAWQLCLLMVLPYVVYKFFGFGHSPISWGLLLIYFLAIALGWVYCVGIAANEALEEKFRIQPLLLRIATIIPFVYVIVFVWVFLLPLSQGEIQRPPQLLIFMHFISLFAAGYSIWYAAKQYTTLRDNQETSFIDYYPAFMGFWFGVIGVWFLQPKISQLFSED